MTQQGHRWYQSTVNRVETGGRTVNFDEAAALGLILDFGLDALSASELHHAIAAHQQLAAAIAAQEEILEELRAKEEEARAEMGRLMEDQRQHAPFFERPPDLTPEELAQMRANREAFEKQEEARREAIRQGPKTRQTRRR
jgi:hypothetical protein